MAGRRNFFTKAKTGRKPETPYKLEVPMKERTPWPSDYFEPEVKSGSTLNGELGRVIRSRHAGGDE